ncbi:MAG: right-handed parallel beta-helix repeat-containing protein [Geobacteraceae bacterium]|nr:right-handed parallel beta-helix repeat-containing protein [Geobacteraceae bacterium]
MKSRKTMQYLLISISAIVFTMFMSTASFSASYYVAASGSDGNPGTAALPWQSVSKVNRTALSPGDTVYFKRGDSWNELLYPASGTIGKVVTYDAYGTGGAPIIRGFYADNKSYITAQNLTFKNNSTDIPFLIYNGSNHITAYNCSIIADSACTAYVALWLSTNVSYNRITNCVITHNNTGRQTDAINLRLNANYNIIQNNIISGATHYCLALEGNTSTYPSYTCNNNIIFGNTVNAHNGAGIAIISGSHNNVVDSNTVTGGKSTSFDVNLPRSLKVVTKNNIVRRNVIRDNTDPNSSGLSTEVYTYGSYPTNVATNNHIYNNVIANVTGYPIVIASDKSSGAAAYNNYYKNNVIVGGLSSTYELTIMGYSTIYDNFFTNNLFYNNGNTNVLSVPTGTYQSVAKIQSSDPTHFSFNLQVDPQLNSDLQPLSGSPCIDTGAFLTTVTSSSGSGTTFTVGDAGYFYNGYGLAAADVIMVGGTLATISNVNYVTNTITVTASISWTQGANVSLPYSGSKPDLGAYEYSDGYSPIPTPPDSLPLAAPLNLRVVG